MPCGQEGFFAISRILVVDDRKANRDLFATILRYRDHVVEEADDGEAALEAVRRWRPDLVISDILMPKMDGFEFVRALRADKAARDVPVIFTSAHYLSHEAQALARKSGIPLVLAKPVEPEVLLGAVERALSGPVPAPTLPPDDLAHEHREIVVNKLKEKVDALRSAHGLLAAMDEFSHTLSAARASSLADLLCTAARRILGARFATVALLDDAGLRVAHFAFAGAGAACTAPQELPHDPNTLIRGCIASRAVLVADDLPGDPARVGLPADHPPARYVLCTPVMTATRVYGWLCLVDKLGVQRFGANDQDIALNLAGQAARAYENGVLLAQAQRRAFALEAEIVRQRKTEEALRESESRARAIADTMPGLLWMCDGAGQNCFANSRWTEFTGRAPAGDRALRIDELVHPEDVEEFRRAVKESTARGEPFSLEHRVRGVAGDYRWFLHSVSPTFDSAGNVLGHIGILVDATARRELEAQLLQAQKLESVGRLSGGIAHDFNNLLTVILGSAEMLSAKVADRPDLLRLAAGIEKASQRAAGLTHRLLAFARRQVLHPKPVELDPLIEGMRDIIGRSIGEDVRFSLRLAGKGAHVFADPVQLESALLNLVVNARDAMPEGGQLEVASALAELSAEEAARTLDAQPGRYAVLSVTDTGTGMPPEIAARACEPFFTTKEVGRGTGLGLSMVHGFVRQSGGFMRIESAPGRGTTIRLHLPLHAAGKAETAPQEAAAPVGGGRETILLVEDDEMVRAFGVRLLGELGYTVVEAADGAQAMALLRSGRPVDLMLSDVVMPGKISGYQLAEAARAMRPELRVILVSGYAQRAQAAEGAAAGPFRLITKPFKRAEIARELRQALDAPAKR